MKLSESRNVPPQDQKVEFEKAILNELDHLYRFALSLTRHENDAEDLVQEVCLKAVRGFERFRAGTKFRAWLFTIMRNTFYSQWRMKRGAPDTKLLGDFSNFSFYASALADRDRMPELVDARGMIDSTKLLDLVEDEVAHAVEALPPEFREVIFLCDVEAFSYSEISKILGVPLGTVRSRLARGRGTLQKLLWGYAQRKGWFKVSP